MILTGYAKGIGRVLRTGLSSLRDRAANLCCRLAALRFNPSRECNILDHTYEQCPRHGCRHHLTPGEWKRFMEERE